MRVEEGVFSNLNMNEISDRRYMDAETGVTCDRGRFEEVLAQEG